MNFINWFDSSKRFKWYNYHSILTKKQLNIMRNWSSFSRVHKFAHFLSAINSSYVWYGTILQNLQSRKLIFCWLFFASSKKYNYIKYSFRSWNVIITTMTSMYIMLTVSIAFRFQRRRKIIVLKIIKSKYTPLCLNCRCRSPDYGEPYIFDINS